MFDVTPGVRCYPFLRYMYNRNQGFSYFFCLVIEGSRSGSGAGCIPLTDGSGSRRPKNMWIRIRIRNTGKLPYLICEFHLAQPASEPSLPGGPSVQGPPANRRKINYLEINFEELCKNQCFGSGSSIVGWIPIRIRVRSGSRVLILKNKNWEKLYCEKFLKENIQHFKTLNFLTFFLFLWVIFSLLDPLNWLNPSPIRIRSFVKNNRLPVVNADDYKSLTC